jgi:hypothetical protein
MHNIFSNLKGFLICDFDGYGLGYGYTSGEGCGCGENDCYETSDFYLDCLCVFGIDYDDWADGDSEVVYLDLTFDGMEE